jgi:hypothetical protein
MRVPFAESADADGATATAIIAAAAIAVMLLVWIRVFMGLLASWSGRITPCEDAPAD